MSATVHYRKTSKSDPHLKNVGAPSSFVQAIERGFGDFPIELDETSIPMLKGMKAASPMMESAFEELIETIEKLGSIELYLSY